MGLTVHFEVLNQLGTPMMYSATLANRPAAGITGRIFFRTDSPYGIFRDTGSAWDQVAGSGGGGNTIYTADDTLTSNRTVSSGGFTLTFTPQTTFFSSLIPAVNASSFAVLGSNNLTYAAGFSSNNIGNVYSANGAINTQIFSGSATFAQANLASAMVNVNSIDFSSPGATVTMTQSTGIRAMTGAQNQIQFQGTNSGTISHAAVTQNLGFYRPPSATGVLTVTNAYGHLINNLNDYGSGFTFTNRYGIYQAGANDANYFAGASTFDNTTSLVGTTSFLAARMSSFFSSPFVGFDVSGAGWGWQIKRGGGIRQTIFGVTGSTIIQAGGTAVDAGYLHDVQGTSRVTGNFIIGSTPATQNITFDGVSANQSINFFKQGVYSSYLTGYGELSYSTAPGGGTYLPFKGSAFNTISASLQDSNLKFSSGTLPNFIQFFATGVIEQGVIGYAAGGNIMQFRTNKATTISNGSLAMAIFENTNVAINTLTDVASAQFQISSTTKGFLPPKMTNAQILAIASPAEGLQIFNTTISHMCFYQGGAWVRINNSPM